MSNEQNILRALLRREFGLFLRYGLREIGGGVDYIHGWYVDAIIHALEEVRAGNCRRLIITLPPRYLKSVIVSTCWPAWLLGLNPSLRIIAASYGQDLAEKFARDSLGIMESRWFRSAFPGLVLARRTIADFETIDGGGRLSTSLNGPLTGRGADLIIIDDPLKGADLMSDNARTAAIDWLTNVLLSRLNDKATGAIVLVMQRLHQADLAGELIERGGWKELRLPAIAEEEEQIPIGGGRMHVRKTGDVLHPQRECRAVLEQQRFQMGSAAFAAQYQQQPVPAFGNIVNSNWLRTYALPVEPLRGIVVQSWDTASKSGLNCDWSVCITAIIVGQLIYVVDVWREKVEFPALLKMAIARARTFSANVLLIEDQASGTQLLQALKAAQENGVQYPTRRRPEADKWTRLSGVSSMIEAGQLLLPVEAPWLADFKAELLAFPSGRHDDQVDALSQLLTWARDQQRFDSSEGIGMPIFPDREPGDDWWN